jgi:regulator of RNase E activity RraA
MDNQEVRRRFAALTTAHLADACIRAQIPVRCAPALLHAAVPGSRLGGRVCPARHVGSVDIFLEALEGAAPGDVLVVDNGGRLDESCVGDLVALEAQAAGLEGIVVWGLHRDTADIRAVGLPLFSLGAIPTGPQRLDARPKDALESATVGDWTVGREDLVVGDDDGVLFVPVTALRKSSRSPKRSATPNGAKPNGSVQVSPCAVRCGLTPTWLGANRRLP